MKKCIGLLVLLGHCYAGALEVVPPKDLLATGMIGEVYNQTDVWLTFNAKDSKGDWKFPFLMLYPSCTQYKKDPVTNKFVLKPVTDALGNPTFYIDGTEKKEKMQRVCLTTQFLNNFLSSSYRSDQGIFFKQLVDATGGNTITLVPALGNSDALNIELMLDAAINLLTVTSKGDLGIVAKYNINLAKLFEPKVLNDAIIQGQWDTLKTQFQGFATIDYAAGSKLFNRIEIKNWFICFSIDGTNKFVEAEIHLLCDFQKKSSKGVITSVAPIFIKISFDDLTKNNVLSYAN